MEGRCGPLVLFRLGQYFPLALLSARSLIAAQRFWALGRRAVRTHRGPLGAPGDNNYAGRAQLEAGGCTIATAGGQKGNSGLNSAMKI